MNNSSTDLNLWDVYRHALDLHADRIALVHGDRSLTYTDLSRAVGHVFERLRAHGVEAGDRVVLLLANGPAYPVTDLAVMALGAVKVPLNAMLSVPEVTAVVERLRPTCVVSDEALVHLAAGVHDGPAVLRLDSGWLDDVAANQPVPGRHDLAPSAPSAVFMSGGTTGRPKGIVHSQHTILQNVWSHLIEAAIERDERLLLTTPLAHAAGIFTLAALARGARVVIEPGFDADRWIDLVESHKITWSYGVPTMVRRIVDAAARRGWRPATVRTLQYGSAPMSPGLLVEALDVFGPVLQQLYAQTECPQFATLLRKEDHARARHEPGLLSSAGRPVAMCDLSIRDGDGSELPAGEVGEVCLRSPYVMTGYWEDDAGYRARFHGTWLRTGDVGRLDAEGYLYLIDRLGDMVISGGMNVYCVEVEAALSTHPAVSQAAVVGLPHDDWGEAVHALVVLHDGGGSAVDVERQLGVHCRDALAAYKRPKSFEIVDEIPVTVYGKYDKKRIRAERSGTVAGTS